MSIFQVFEYVILLTIKIISHTFECEQKHKHVIDIKYKNDLLDMVLILIYNTIKKTFVVRAKS